MYTDCEMLDHCAQFLVVIIAPLVALNSLNALAIMPILLNASIAVHNRDSIKIACQVSADGDTNHLIHGKIDGELAWLVCVI